MGNFGLVRAGKKWAKPKTVAPYSCGIDITTNGRFSKQITFVVVKHTAAGMEVVFDDSRTVSTLFEEQVNFLATQKLEIGKQFEGVEFIEA